MSGLMKALTGSVSGLGSFAIRVLRGVDAPFLAILEEFLQRITKLESVSVNGMPKQVLQSAVHYHGKHLRCLCVRHTGPGSVDLVLATDRLCFFTPEEIGQLAIGLPPVERLGVDLVLKKEIVSARRCIKSCQEQY
jgi:hypothetical protein